VEDASAALAELDLRALPALYVRFVASHYAALLFLKGFMLLG
jgi:hypothetical protein